jgi:hypothetical protein
MHYISRIEKHGAKQGGVFGTRPKIFGTGEDARKQVGGVKQIS